MFISTFAVFYYEISMSDELIAIVCLFAYSVFSSIVALVQLRRTKQEIYEFGDSIIEGFGQMFTEPTVKKAFTILGKQGGEAKAENALVDQMAMDMLDSPQFQAIKLGASAMGFDIDEYIEKHGAVKTIAAARQLGNMLGIDITNIDLSSLAKPGGFGQGQQGGNPYFGK